VKIEIFTYAFLQRTGHYISLSHRDNQVVAIFFISFLTTPISSQSDTLVESYDKNAETCAASS
jgi:hypothetical protein